MNALIVQPHVEHGSLGPDIDVKEGPALATQIAFPLLERIAQKWTQGWSDDGILSIDIPEEVGLLSKAKKPKILKPGQKLFGFSDRMQVLRWKLDQWSQELLDNVDQKLALPEIAGLEHAPPLFQRLSNRRNAWSHGHAYEYGEPYLLSLLTGFFYSVSWVTKRET